MSGFLTLMRREFTENKGGLFWTPIVVAAVILVLTAVSALTGTLSMGDVRLTGDGATISVERSVDQGGRPVREEMRIQKKGDDIVITGSDGETATLDQLAGPQGSARIGLGLLVGTSVLSLLFVVVMAISIIPQMIDGPAGERKDRSVLFWKSMPASDLQTLISKLVTPLVVGFPMALAAGFATQLGILAILSMVLSANGLGGLLPALSVGLLAQAWGILALGVLSYVLWMLPVYAWLQLAASIAPKNAFLVAIGVPLGIGVLEAMFNLPTGLGDHILDRLTGDLTGFDTALGGMSGSEAMYNLDFTAVYGALLASFSDWRLWAGFVVCAGLVYAASEVRRRVAL
jgi:ABC-2 type transport system permease protein